MMSIVEYTIEYSSLFYTVGPCWLSILYMVVYIYIWFRKVILFFIQFFTWVTDFNCLNLNIVDNSNQLNLQKMKNRCKVLDHHESHSNGIQ